jgi:hypothetical protein
VYHAEILIVKYKGKRPHGRLKVDGRIIKMDLKEI